MTKKMSNRNTKSVIEDMFPVKLTLYCVDRDSSLGRFFRGCQ